MLVSYLLKDRLKLSPSASQFVSSVAFFPWSIKPLYGMYTICSILSDCVPIKGRRRIPYLMIATVLSLFPWLILGQDSCIRSSRVPLMVFLTVQNLGSAMADVVVDAMIAEAVRFERASFAGDLQSISWMTMALGGIFGSLLGGYALANLKIENIFLLFAVLPSVQLLSCILVKENVVGSRDLHEYPTSNDSDGANGNITDLDSDSYSDKKSKTSTSRRKKNKKGRQKRSNVSEKFQNQEKHGSLVSQWFGSLKMATYSLARAFRQPIIIRFMPFMILSGQLCPPGIEGTLFALFMSINNFGSTLGSFVGAGLASALNISSERHGGGGSSRMDPI
ncbi:unnamed protein product [Thlaspi arvense]|uniref:Biopterin transport-related protein BT1 n=1 Tax=Thlaspi arvense TaxID=13288 RepID=A0AAU9RJY9_THLAR|nr:unnamed protein product [Thlaspi arvense]